MILSEHWPKTLDEAMQILAGVPDGMPVVANYTRVSSDVQVDEGHSLEMQAEHQRTECAARYPGGCHILFLADEGLSGTLFWKKDGLRKGQYRPGLTMLKDLVDLGVVHAVGVYRCNRFARRARIWLEFKEDHLDPNNVVFFSTSDGIDTAQSGTEMIFHILMSEAEHARAQIASGVKDGLATRRSEGYYVGCPPYGWRWQDERFVPDGSRKNIEPVPEETEVIRLMNEWCIGGMSLRAIARRLTDDRVPTATGGSVWSKCVVKAILANPTNAGLIRDGSGGLLQGLHYPQRIIEPEIYCGAQDVLIGRREAAIDDNRPEGLIFDGMLTCGICGARLGLSSPKNEIPHYVCRGRRKGKEHPMFWLRVDLVESRLQKAVLGSATSEAASSRAAARLKQQSDDYEQELRRTARRLNDRLARNHDGICLWAGRMGQTQYDQQEVEAELAHLAEERRMLEGELREARREAKRRKSRERKCQATAANVVKLWDRATLEERRELVPQLVESITCEPTDTGVTVRISFITGDATDIPFYVRAKAAQECGDLEAIRPSLLTTAHYLQQGLSAKEIAHARGIAVGTVHSQQSALKRTTGASTIGEALDRLIPVVQARADELRGRRKP